MWASWRSQSAFSSLSPACCLPINLFIGDAVLLQWIRCRYFSSSLSPVVVCFEVSRPTMKDAATFKEEMMLSPQKFVQTFTTCSGLWNTYDCFCILGKKNIQKALTEMLFRVCQVINTKCLTEWLWHPWKCECAIAETQCVSYAWAAALNWSVSASELLGLEASALSAPVPYRVKGSTFTVKDWRVQYLRATWATCRTLCQPCWGATFWAVDTKWLLCRAYVFLSFQLVHLDAFVYPNSVFLLISSHTK